MRGNHPRVARMKLIGEPLALELFVNGINAIGDNQRGPGRTLGEEVAHGAIERTGEAHLFPFARD